MSLETNPKLNSIVGSYYRGFHDSAMQHLARSGLDPAQQARVKSALESVGPDETPSAIKNRIVIALEILHSNWENLPDAALLRVFDQLGELNSHACCNPHAQYLKLHELRLVCKSWDAAFSSWDASMHNTFWISKNYPKDSPFRHYLTMRANLSQGFFRLESYNEKLPFTSLKKLCPSLRFLGDCRRFEDAPSGFTTDTSVKMFSFKKKDSWVNVFVQLEKDKMVATRNQIEKGKMTIGHFFLSKDEKRLVLALVDCSAAKDSPSLIKIYDCKERLFSTQQIDELKEDAGRQKFLKEKIITSPIDTFSLLGVPSPLFESEDCQFVFWKTIGNSDAYILDVNQRNYLKFSLKEYAENFGGALVENPPKILGLANGRSLIVSTSGRRSRLTNFNITSDEFFAHLKEIAEAFLTLSPIDRNASFSELPEVLQQQVFKMLNKHLQLEDYKGSVEDAYHCQNGKTFTEEDRSRALLSVLRENRYYVEKTNSKFEFLGQPVKEGIFIELGKILNSSSSAEDAFYCRNEQTSTREQRAQAIDNYIASERQRESEATKKINFDESDFY